MRLNFLRPAAAGKAVAFAACFAILNVAVASPASASLLNLQIGPAQIFDVQYNWSSTTGNLSCGYADPAACDTLNVSGLQSPISDSGTHPALTTGQYFGFFNSTTVAGTFGLAVFNADGTESYVFDNSGSLQKLSPDGIFYLSDHDNGTVITPDAGYAHNSSATLSVGVGTPSNADALAFTPPSNAALNAGETVSDVPEPASIALMAGALVGMGAVRSRKGKLLLG